MIQPPALLLGDGARLYAGQLLAPGLSLGPAWAESTRPGLLALLGEKRLEEGESLPPEQLTPRYCRPSEAEIRFGLPLDDYCLLK
jgi:tRNA threonylcarbamoyladenosine biosynthesis protein TsaB